MKKNNVENQYAYGELLRMIGLNYFYLKQCDMTLSYYMKAK